MLRNVIFLLVVSVIISNYAFAQNIEQEKKLYSLTPEKILSKLDLDKPGLKKVKAAVEKGDRHAALAALLDHYRSLYLLPNEKNMGESIDFTTADNAVNHIFQWGPYDPVDYGDSIDWQLDFRGDIEWVAAVYRFHWAKPLVKAFAATREEKYAKAFVELASDWIIKHPLEERDIVHPVYTNWRGFPWLNIQTGLRATVLCQAFRTLVHAKSFTPEFLGVFLSSIYDHQVKTENIPMGSVHNKALMEQRGFADIAATFREFRDSGQWMELALERTRESLLSQTTSDGVQCEWSAGYHLHVLQDAVEIMKSSEKMGITVPDDFRERIRLMYNYVFAVATPELGWAMFGDVSRKEPLSNDRSTWSLYNTLVEAAELFGDQKYAARAKLDRAYLPAQKSYAFSEAGMYVLRNEWGPEQVYFAFHSSPLPLDGWHDQPDNGTFELYAFGRWLMTDSGYYTYGHAPESRAWHRQTRVHQTLTLNGKNSEVDARPLLWVSAVDCDVVIVENSSYDNLVHRRSIWFVEKSFFVLLDEALGNAEGELALHYQFAVGDASLETERKWASTAFDDANVLVWAEPDAPLTMEEEKGWFAWEYGKRKPRKAFCFKHAKPAPQRFVTLLVPYRGTEIPEVSAAILDNPPPEVDRIELDVTAFGKSWRIGHNLVKHEAWCRKKY
jgi:heparan-sulfate lyase